MKNTLLISLSLLGLVLVAPSDFAQAAKKYKMTTPIPAEITTPDKVETSIGTLNFEYGMPDEATIKKVYNNIDLARAVDVYLNTQSGVSIWGFRKGMRDIGVKDHTLLTMEKMTDSTGMYLTPNTVTPQTYTFLNLKNGPVVMEVPRP